MQTSSSDVGERGLSRRALIATGLGAGALVAAGGVARVTLYEKLRWSEDFFPGEPPDAVLTPNAWTTTNSAITFAVLGDNGSGGRNAMDVARRMVETYERTPFGVVLLAGDVSYYGSIDDRWEHVFVKPYRPLIEAGVEWDLAIGNHEIAEKRSDRAAQEIDRQLRRFGKPGTFYTERHGPVDVFVIDSSTPMATGEKTGEQVAWLETALRASSARWKVALLHHPLYSSGRHGSNLRVREAIEPLLVDGGVDVVFAGHDHHYERSKPQSGVVHIVSGGGCKLTRVGRSEFTEVATSVLQFVLVEVDGDAMRVRCIKVDGEIVDDFTLEKGPA